MLTKTGRTLRNGGAALAVAGVLFGNWPVFGAGAFLLLLVASSTLSRAPSVRRALARQRIERGGRVQVTMEVHLPRGLGVAEVHQALPEEFELVEGSNFHALTMSLVRKQQVTKTFEVRVPKRGEYHLPPVGVKLLHPAGLSVTTPLEAGEPATLIVEPRPIPASIPRDLRARAKRPFPEGDVARMGVATNDFRELREYVPGDPPRRINWKATARRMGTGESEVPLVNQTEWEGKKAVYVLVDGHPRLSVGTNLEDARELAADAALSLVEEYLRRGYQVAVALARSGDVPAVRFGTGEAQVRRAREALARLQPAEGPGMMDVLERDAAMLHRFKPLVVVVTRLATSDDEDLRAAMRRLGAMGRRNGRNLVPGLLLDVEPSDAKRREGGPEAAAAAAPVPAPFALARRALENERLNLIAAARAADLRVVTWRAGREPLQSVLMKGVLR